VKRYQNTNDTVVMVMSGFQQFALFRILWGEGQNYIQRINTSVKTECPAGMHRHHHLDLFVPINCCLLLGTTKPPHMLPCRT